MAFSIAAKHADWNVQLYDMPRRDKRGFIVKSNGVRILIDHGDLKTLAVDVDDFKLCFKYHWNEQHCSDRPNVHPWSPITFYNWFEFDELRRKFETDFMSHPHPRVRIAANQIPYAGARSRRLRVHDMLRREFGKRVDTKIKEQKTFWRHAYGAMCAVCVPGQRNDILDRGQLQLMAFGVPTVSPKLSTVLPDGVSPVPGRHYFQCRSDYSDLIDVVKYIDANPEHARRIGNAARSMFNRNCLPEILMFHFFSKLYAVVKNAIS